MYSIKQRTARPDCRYCNPHDHTCYCCGVTIVETEYGAESDLFHDITLYFGYGSGYDEEKWGFKLCEECIVNFVKTFKHPPKVMWWRSY